MNSQNEKSIFAKLVKITEEQPPADLGEKIKNDIPQKLNVHKKLDSINIIIDFRINKLTAAAVIILTLILSLNFMGGRDYAGDLLYKDSSLIFKYLLMGPQKTVSQQTPESIENYYQSLLSQGEDVVYYGKPKSDEDCNSIIMYWKRGEDSYKVIYSDFSLKTVTSDELIKLQNQMIKNAFNK